ncbi:DNA oxidative demethylase AlkB [Polaromonas sp. DSR2-3-2]|uniref:DNA oxidative demethylase AlkB n=1 Tax=unclassified Polaromonas TaxID=2638319 RepID=UPI003CEF7A12
MTLSLFDEPPAPHEAPQLIAPGAVLLHGFASDLAEALVQAAQQVIAAAPLRHLITPGGRAMSVGMTNCGALGWTSSRTGYRYTSTDPLSGQPWPPMPACFADMAARAAAEAGFEGFAPDACLINRYEPGARMSLHQDRDESDLGAPIVSVSLGLPAVFLFGGLQRGDRPARYGLAHGDVAVWGGASRLAFHGVAPLEGGDHPRLGRQRINLTFRRAG